MFGGETVSKNAEKFCVIIFGHYIIFGEAELYGLFKFKFAFTIIEIQLAFPTVVSGCYSLCVYYKYMCIRM